jgi:large repetitive protein
MAFGDTITEAVLGKVSVPEDTDNTPNAIAEGAAVNTTVGITAHSTFANGNAGLDYTLSADSSGGGFKIDHNTGVVTVADPSKIDFESAPGHVYTITVLATKNSNFSNSQTFTISVNDVAPSAPVDSNAAANTVLEGAANGTTVGVTASSTDVNGGAVTYSLIGDTSGGGFTVNATTGVVTVADGSKIDFESSAGHAYTVTVQSSDGTLTSSQAFTINVGDVALTTPVDTNGAANSVAEGAAAGTTVGITASATDPSGPATTYSLIGDTSGGGFTINSATGVVTVANPAKLDFESSAPGHTYNITVQASNGTTTTSQVFTVGVTDVAPSAPTDSNGAANTVAEGAANGTVVGVTASSADVNGGALTYSLTGDTSGGGFTINATTGVITVADSTKINFETAPGHAYNVTAQASDGTLANSQTFTIAVTDVAPTAPVDNDGATNTVAEGAANGSTVGVTAFSTDVNGPGVTYSLVGDSSGGGFTINSTTGVITVADGTKLDYETTPSHNYTVTAQASDGTLTNSHAFTIALTDVAPTAPTDIDGATNTVAEGAANGSTVGITASSVDPNGPATAYSLTDSAGGRFAINSSTGVVTVANGAAIDFETAAGHAYGITVLATNGALTTSSAFSIGVTDVAPSTPIDSNATFNTLFEGAANGTVVAITASSTDPGGGPAPTYTLTDSAGGRFAIDSTTGVVTVANGAAIDFETAPGPNHSYVITVQSTAGALSASQNFFVEIGNVNEAPVGTDKTVTMLEGDSYAFSVADFGFSDPSDSFSPHSLLAVKMTTVPGAGTGTFTNNGVTVNAGDSISATDIAAGHLVFTPTAHANGSPEASFTFQVQDNGGTANGGVDLDQSPNTVTINVNAVNDAPVNSVPLAAQSVNEEATLTFSVGNGNAITISDVDVGSGNETVTLTVANGTLALGSHAGLVSFSPDNAASITLTGTIANIDNALNGLTYTGNLNFNGTETLTVSTNDNGNTGAGGPKIDSDPITINVAAVNDAPVNTVPGAQTVNEDTALVFNGATTISISDVDANGGNETVTLSVASGALTLNGTTGLSFTTGDGTADSTMTFTGTVSDINTALNGLSYQGNLNFNGSDTLNITTNDNGNTGSGGPLSAAGHVDITVSAVNDAPVVTAGHTLSYTENQAATAFDPAITVSDVDSPNLASATVQITGGYVNGEDVLAFSNTASITGTFDPSTGKLTLTGSDTVAHYHAALASVTYVNTSDNPSGAARTVTIVANDGALDSIAATDTINVAPVNDAPVVTAGHTLGYTENQAATAIDPAIAVSDVDSANLASATVQITGNYVTGEDVLAFANTATITGSFDAGTGKLTLTGSDTVAHYQAALASVTYVNTSDNPSGAARTVTVVTNDGALDSVAATDTINVTPVNDAPVATAGHTLAYTENQAATAIDSLITVSDVDSVNLVSATVQITGNYANSQDVLSFTDQNGIAGSFNAATGTMTLTGSSSVANYQAALDSVKYFNTSDDPSGAARTVTIITNDGAANSVAVTDTITVTPVNDAPTLTATGNNPNYSNGVDLFSGVTASTVENGQLLDQLKLTVTNISGTATDSLTIDGVSVALTDGNVVSTSTPGVTATVAVSGSTATVTVDSTPGLSDAAMSALIDGLSYTDTNVNPGDPARVVTITQLHDTGGTSPGVDTSVLNITSTVFFDQAPVVTAGHTLSYTENQAATAFDTAITVTDADNANLASATVQITGGYVIGEDVLAFSNTASITGTFDSSTGKLTLSGSDTVAHYQAALASITYVNTSENPSGAPRTVTIVANDGAVNSTPVTDTINVTPVNDAPVVIAGHTLSYTENQGAAVLDAAVAVFDVDSANLASATVQITGNYVNGEDVLAFSNTANITGSFDSATGKLTLTGSDTVANYQAALRSITYTDTSENPSGLARTVTIIANDGAIDSVAKTDTINVTPVNDAPVTTAGGTLSYTENQAAAVIDSGVTVTDVDNANMASATVSIGTGFATGQDVLDANVTGTTIGKSYNAATGVLTLTGSDTKAHYQQVLDSVTYFNSSENPSGAARTINYTVNDGTANSNTSSATVNVTPVNDAPVVTIGATTAFSEPANGTPAANSVPVTIAPSLTVSDVDSANLTQATFVLNNLKPSDALSVSGHAGSTGSIGGINFAITSTATTETVTFTGTDTIANYNSALHLVQFNNTSENPDTTTRTYTVTAVDDGGTANGGNNTGSGNGSETVTAVNDAPVNTVPVEQDAIFSRTATAITGLSVSDVDSGAGETTVLSVAHGTLNVLTVGGGAVVTNNGTTAVTLTGTAEQIATTLAASNGVVYTSGAFTGADVLTVTTNDNGATGAGAHPNVVSTENLGIIPKVWFIDNTASSVGADGSQGHPFNSIAAFNAVNDGGAGHPQTNDYIYLKTGSGVYSETDGIHLLNGQQLVGGGDGLTFPDPLHAGTVTVETAGTRPVIDVTGGAGNDAIHLAQDNTIHGFNVATENAAATGIVDNGGTVGTLNISNMNVGVDPDGGGALLGNLGQAISITHGGTGGSMTFGTVSSGGGTTGIALGGALVTSFSATGGTLSGHSTSEVAISGGSGTLSYGGTIGDGTGLSASVSGRTAGTVTLSGNINDTNDLGGGITVSGNTGGTIDFTGATKTLNTTTGNAVSLSSNTGATIDFTGGGLGITTTSGTGFSASSGGTYTVTGTGNTISTTSGTALNLSSVTIGTNGVTFDSASTTSAATGISIDTVTGGAINVNGGSIAGATTRGVDINAAQNNITIASSVASTSAGRSVEVTNSGKVGGNTISFSGAITDPGLGINLDNNDQNTNGATVNFSGGLNIDSTTNTGFNAINGGTVNVTNGANNSINTTTGTALNIANTTIGSSNVTFHDISSNGAVNGIVLNNTGSSGHLTVTGAGSTVTDGSNSSGGTIQSTTGAGISLTNTQAPSFTNMLIQNTAASGIQGTGVHDFTFNNGKINNSGTGHAVQTSNIAFNTQSAGTENNVDGAITINGNVLTNAYYHGISIFNFAGTISDANISNNTITSGTTTGAGGTSQGSGIQFVGFGSATTVSSVTKAEITGNHINNFPGGDPVALEFGNSAASGPSGTYGTPGNATNVIALTGNTIVGGGSPNPNNVVLAVLDGKGQGHLNISNNTLSGSAGNVIDISSQGAANLSVNVANNNIDGSAESVSGTGGIAAGAGQFQMSDGSFLTTPTLTIAATGNVINHVFGYGVRINDADGSPTVNATITGNTVSGVGVTGEEGIQVEQLGAVTGSTLNLAISGNTTAGQSPFPGIGLREQTGNTFNILGLTPSPATGAQASTYVAGQNPGSVGGADTFGPGNTYTAIGSVPLPLIAASGGVQASVATPGEMHLTQAELDSVVAAAIAQWSAAGASSSQLAAMLAVTFSVADLAGNTVGEQSPGHITVDTNAAGHGWFVDPTPNDNSEFTHAQSATGTDLLTDPSNAAAGHLDLLTTVTHELGHVIGLEDSIGLSDANDLMYINLVDGERRLPDSADVAQANALDSAQTREAALPVSAQAAAGTPVITGTAGNDTIDAGHGGNLLFGGAGADNFVFGPSIQLNAPTPAQITHVADYSAAQGDTFDFSAITSAFHNSSVSDSLVVRAVEDASGKFATLQVDHIDPMGLPSAPNWVNVAQLDGVHSGDAVNILIDSHSSVHLAQIHVDLLV